MAVIRASSPCWPTTWTPTGRPLTPISGIVMTMPLIGVSGLPVGVQVVGQQGEDARITAIARWILETIDPVVV